mmetsp:Transcript_1881/g.3729  ORF Transcript_1881/g.3729 Transcript_1881/m.3729 type:complete len:166 (-) Transcript_1881:439-936(-)
MNVSKQSNSHSVVPRIKRVRTITLVDGKYLCCDCGRWKETDIACEHVANVMDEVNEHCWGMIRRTDYTFYFGREGVDPALNRMFQDLAFTTPRVTEYPVACGKAVPLSEFLAVKEATWPVVLNWDKGTVEEAIYGKTEHSRPHRYGSRAVPEHHCCRPWHGRCCG